MKISVETQSSKVTRYIFISISLTLSQTRSQSRYRYRSIHLPIYLDRDICYISTSTVCRFIYIPPHIPADISADIPADIHAHACKQTHVRTRMYAHECTHTHTPSRGSVNHRASCAGRHRLLITRVTVEAKWVKPQR